MTDYTQGKIYKIVGEDGVYVGSTVQSLETRIYNHIHNKKTSRVLLIDKPFSFELIEDFPCNSKPELLARERYWIEELKSINKRSPIIYEAERRDIKLKNQKRSYNNNIEKEQQARRDYNKENREAILAQKKEHYEENKEAILLKKRERYKEARDKRLLEKIII